MITSFSSLSPHSDEITKYGIATSKDYDENDNIDSEDVNIPIKSSIDIFNFPAGAKIGTCWHEIFDFNANDDEIAKIVKEKLSIYGINNGKNESEIDEKEASVIKMVRNVLNTTLCTDNSLSLSKISPFKTNILKKRLAQLLLHSIHLFGAWTLITSGSKTALAAYLTGILIVILFYLCYLNKN
jgi:ATP-dependent exoDNAse (exonuclease V) beta subunit